MFWYVGVHCYLQGRSLFIRSVIGASLNQNGAASLAP